MFHEKLTILIKISGTSNTMIARYVNLDTSYISRLKNGKRNLPKNHDFLKPMIEYLFKKIKNENQLTALHSAIGIDTIDFSDEEYIEIIYKWLIGKDSLIVPDDNKYLEIKTNNTSKIYKEKRESRIYYGNEGKRKAVLTFLQKVIHNQKPTNLYIVSDENLNWIYEDPNFTEMWKGLVLKCLLLGNNVKIIHTINREFSEIVPSINVWLPLYMSGRIQPYYYPKLRDSLFQRTLFIAEDLCAISAVSIGFKTEEMANFYVTEKTAIDALIKEFNHFVNLSNELLEIYKREDIKKIHDTFRDFFNASGDAVYKSALPLLFALPKGIMYNIAENAGSKELIKIYELQKEMFLSSIEKYKTTIFIGKYDTIMKDLDKINIQILESIYSKKIFFSKEEYTKAYHNLKELEEEYENLTVIEVDDISYDICFYCKDNYAIISNNSYSHLVFTTKTNLLIEAIKEFLSTKFKLKS